MASTYRKQPCRCTHAKSIHHAKPAKKTFRSPCGFPGCRCRDYKPTKT